MSKDLDRAYGRIDRISDPRVIPVDLRPMARSDPVERIRIPYTPRSVFSPYHRRKQRFAITVAHRRAGKTVAEINEGVRKVLSIPRAFPPPQAAFISPTFGQGKRNAWLYAKHYTSNIPGMKNLEAETTLVFPHGGRLILAGSDNFDGLRGVYLDHCSLDEYAIQDPRIWGEVIRASLSDYAGTATFIGSAKGRNHFYDLLKDHEEDPDWLITILKASETGILSEEELALARKTMTPEEYAQEYECSFDAAVKGTFYGQEIEEAERSHRITSVSYDTAAPVYAALDLGIGGATAIWVFQLVGNEIHLLKFYQDNDVKLANYVDWLLRLPYPIQTLYVPHDAEQRELQTGLTRTEFFQNRGLKCHVLTRSSVDGGISAARVAFSRVWIDKANCKEGIDCLRMYRRAYDPKRKSYSEEPFKDWTEHAADAYRYVIQSTPFAQVRSDWGQPIRRNLRVVV